MFVALIFAALVALTKLAGGVFVTKIQSEEILQSN